MTEPSQLPFFRESAHHLDLSQIDPHQTAAEAEPVTVDRDSWAAPPVIPSLSSVILPSSPVILPQAGSPSPSTQSSPINPTPPIVPTSPIVPLPSTWPQAEPPYSGTTPSGVIPPGAGSPLISPVPSTQNDRDPASRRMTPEPGGDPGYVRMTRGDDRFTPDPPGDPDFVRMTKGDDRTTRKKARMIPDAAPRRMTPDPVPKRMKQPDGAPPVVPLSVPSLSQIPWASNQGIDWAAVATMRTAASTRLSNRIGTSRLDKEHQQSLGRVIITDLLREHESEALAAGKTPWEPAYQARMGQAVFDALFQLGRLQPLVDDDRIENIIISGADNVWLEFSDGSLVRGPAVADSDQELIDFLSFIASRSEVNERSFSPAEPRLHMRLDTGARLAAAAWVTPRPSVVIRRHRLQEVTLNDLVDRHTLTVPMARFLAEAVRRRASIVVSGAQGVGKTTLMRALCAEIPPEEVIGTFETEYELHLHLMGNLHRVVHAWEARPGSGEMDASGHRAGEFGIDDALYDSFRFNLSRQIVGEVRGREILAMLKAMQSGSGSLSTTHAHSAEGAIRKLITCAMEAGPHVTSEYATRAIAEDIDFFVHMDMTHEDAVAGNGFRHRWVKEIIAVQPSDSVRGYATTRLFSTPVGEVQAVMETVPEDYLDAIDPIEEMWNLPWS